jgi:molybdopterin converting factor subunit 1
MAAVAAKELTVLYFASLRERIRTAEERLAVPETVADVAGLMDWLSARSQGHAAAFANRTTVRYAVNQMFAQHDTPVRAGDEVAFFPPVTGG